MKKLTLHDIRNQPINHSINFYGITITTLMHHLKVRQIQAEIGAGQAGRVSSDQWRSNLQRIG